MIDEADEFLSYIIHKVVFIWVVLVFEQVVTESNKLFVGEAEVCFGLGGHYSVVWTTSILYTHKGDPSNRSRV